MPLHAHTNWHKLNKKTTGNWYYGKQRMQYSEHSATDTMENKECNIQDILFNKPVLTKNCSAVLSGWNMKFYLKILGKMMPGITANIKILYH